jgi:DNA segregation ATPase FtsK/SpoIIIE, S-DNA-T family
MNPPELTNPFREYKISGLGDYRPEWDVVSFAAEVSDTLTRQIRAQKGRSSPSPDQKIPVIVSQGGYGKTHLYGRISHALAHEVFFVFVPPFENPRAPLQHIAFHVVEALFRVPRGEQYPVLVRELARLCQPSLGRYFQEFPPSLRERHRRLFERLAEDVAAVAHLTTQVRTTAPFLRLADSLARAFPGLPHAVVKALGLCWAPPAAATSARRWLRGEMLPEDDARLLGLPEDPPQVGQVLSAVAALFQYQIPVVICCDNTESVTVDPEAPAILGAKLMELLASVPVFIVLNCLKDKWKTARGDGLFDRTYTPFQQRLEEHFLRELRGNEALELVRLRLQAWNGTGRSGVEPFDEASITQLARENQVYPRSLIKECEKKLDRWLADGKKGLIKVGEKSAAEDLDVLFVQIWQRELEAIRGDPERRPVNVQEERLYRAVREALALARDAGRSMGGVQVFDLEDGVYPPAKAERHGLKVTLAQGTGRTDVLVTVSKISNGVQFRGLYSAMEKLMESVAGSLLVHLSSQPPMGAKTRERFDEAFAAGRVCVLALEDSTSLFPTLECLLDFLDRAAAQDLPLGDRTLSSHDCRTLILKTGVLDGLELFSALGTWIAPQAPGAQGSNQVKSRTPRENGVQSPVPLDQVPPGQISPPAPDPNAERCAWVDAKLDEAVQKLTGWGLPVMGLGAEIGPTFARLRIQPAGARATFRKIRDRGVDLRIHLGLEVLPLISSQAGYVSVDVQLPERSVVQLGDVLVNEPVALAGQPAFPVGMDVAGISHWLNLADPSDCHLLVAGMTGSGKSEFLRAMVASLASRLPPEQLQFVFIDPKRVTFNLQGKESPYLRCPVAHNDEDALTLIRDCLDETGRRYRLLEARGRSDVSQLETSLLPRIVIVIDEFANLMEDKQVKKVLTALLKKIGSMARAAGIHLVLSTQRPDKDVVTPLLRDNLPGRIALRVPAEAGSNLVLGEPDAAHLLGKGDLIWKSAQGLLRLQSPLATDVEFDASLRTREPIIADR